MDPRALRPYRLVCYVSLSACSLLGLVMWAIGDIALAQNVLVRDTVVATTLFMILHALASRLVPRALPHVQLPWLATALRLAPPALELLVFRFWVPGAVTVVSYLLLPYSLPLADAWLAAPEQTLGIAHWRTWAWFDAAGLLPALAHIYESLDWQIYVMFFYWLLARRDLTRVYEYSALSALLGSLSVLFLWAMPAEGPWAFYQGRYADPPPMPGYLPALRGLRENTFVDLDNVYGFLNFPSFHTVFALLLMYAMRGTPLFWPAVVLNTLVIVSTVPIGWHYLVDILGGVGFFFLGVAALRAVQQRQGPSAAGPTT